MIFATIVYLFTRNKKRPRNCLTKKLFDQSFPKDICGAKTRILAGQTPTLSGSLGVMLEAVTVGIFSLSTNAAMSMYLVSTVRNWKGLSMQKKKRDAKEVGEELPLLVQCRQQSEEET